MRTLILPPETHTMRQATQHECLHAQLAGRWGEMKWNNVIWGKKYFVLGRLEVTWQDKYLLYTGTTSPAKQPSKDRFYFCTLWVLIYLSLNRFPPLSSLSGYHALSCSGVLRWNWTPPPSPRQLTGRSLQQPSSQLPSYTTVQVSREQQFRYLGKDSSGT
jgi:hypothetical protein